MTVIPIVICTLGTIPKGLLKGFKEIKVKGQVVTIKTSALRRGARILRRVPET